MRTLIWIAIAGSCGAVSRYGIYLLTNKLYQGGFPWATIVVNLSGCLLFGLIYSLSEHRVAISSETRLILLVGFVAAFTTFSTFAFENVEFLRHSQWFLLGLNISIQNVVGIAFVFLGAAWAAFTKPYAKTQEEIADDFQPYAPSALNLSLHSVPQK